MRARRAVALGVVVWVVVAVAGASLVWGVISRAGEGVSGGLDPVPSAEGGNAAGTTEGRTLSPSPSPSPSSPSPSGSSPSASGTASPESPGTAASVTRTWQGAAGLVSATCEGVAIRHSGSSASSGYHVEVDDTGPDRVRVEFENDDNRTRVEAECVQGAPEFVVDVDD